MKELKQVPPNLGIKRKYEKKLKKLVSAMDKSVMYWLLADYGGRTANQMAKEIQKRIKQWKDVFGKESDKIAKWFVESVKKNTEAGVKKSLKDVGIKPKVDGVSKNVLNAVEIENEGLIESIPEKYFSGVETVAMLSLLYAWSKSDLTNELKKRYNITIRRVRIISEDQTHKTTEVFKRDIYGREGLKEGKWVYTYRSETPRESHIMMDGQIFDLEKGALTPEGDAFIFPGQLINCKCDFRPIIREFGDEEE